MKNIRFCLLYLITIGCLPCLAQSTVKGSSRPVFRLTAGYDRQTPDPVVVYFDKKPSSAFHKDFDALKRMNSDTAVPSLYVYSGDSIKAAILGLPDQNYGAQIIPLGIRTQHDGKITFNTSSTGAIPYTYIYLKDQVTGILTDLHSVKTASLLLPKGNYENRFSLLFTNRAYAGIPSPVVPVWNAYSASRNIYITLDSVSGLNGIFTIYSMMGQLVYTESLSGSGLHIISTTLDTQLYIIGFSSETGQHTKKVYIGL